MKILVIDNYDSFTYNLVQLLGEFTSDIVIRRNDRTSLEEIEKLKPEYIVISPGPGRPEDANITLDVIRELGPKTPLLGVCLGHQGIGVVFGGQIVHAPNLMHGKVSEIVHDGDGLHRNIPQKFTAGRYHSLAIDKVSLPKDLKITAETTDGIIMGVRHRKFPIQGIQYHPESVLTEHGKKIIKNWLELSHDQGTD